MRKETREREGVGRQEAREEGERGCGARGRGKRG